MDCKRRLTALSILVGTFLLFLALATSAYASPISEKKARLAKVQAKLELVYHKADVAAEKYNQANAQLNTVRQQIKENKRLLQVAEYNLTLANAQLLARAERMYKTRDVGLVDVLFASRSFEDLVTQLRFIDRIGDSDAETVAAVDAYRTDIKQRRAKLDTDEEQARTLVKERAAQKKAIADVEHELENTKAGLKAEIRQLEEQARREAARRAAAAAAAAAAAQNGGGTHDGGGGGGGTDPGSVPDPGGSGRSAVVAIAQRYLGVPYVYGGASPSGFDCSGLTMYCYAKIGISLAHGATLQQKASTPVPIRALQSGDLVFFGNSAFSSHVGIYVGGSTMIHAPHTGDVVRYGDMSSAWIGGRF